MKMIFNRPLSKFVALSQFALKGGTKNRCVHPPYDDSCARFQDKLTNSVEFRKRSKTFSDIAPTLKSKLLIPVREKVLWQKFLKIAQFTVPHCLLLLFLLILFIPLYLAVVASSHPGSALISHSIPLLPGKMLLTNFKTVLINGITEAGGEPIYWMLLNSLIMAMCIAVGKILFALCSAFALVYFNFPFKKLCFSLIFITMMLPVEVRIVPTFQIVTSLGWLNSYLGLTLPLMASATATFLFRQFFKTIPAELVEAAKLDGAGPIRFFVDILLPLSRPQIAALFVILFVYGWNQYLWPLVITTNADMSTIVMGIRYLAGVADQIPQWHLIMAVALIALIPPCLVVILMQRWFEKGLSQ